MDEPAEVVRFMLFGEPYEAPEADAGPEPEPEPSPLPAAPWSAMEEPAEVVRFMLFGEPYEAPEAGPEPPLPVEVSDDREDWPAAWQQTEAEEVSAAATSEPISLPIETDDEADIAVEAPLVAWPVDPSPVHVSAPERSAEGEPPIYLPGEKPPTLTGITAPRLRVGRGLAIALALHAAVLGTALSFLHEKARRLREETSEVNFVLETVPQGNTENPTIAHHMVVQTPPNPSPVPPLPLPTLPPLDDENLASTPSHALVVPRTPTKPVQPVLVQGNKAKSDHIGVQNTTTNRPATPDVGNAKPDYPLYAKALGEEGKVSLMVLVLPNGLVGGVEIVKSSGYPRLDEAARHALFAWHFHPALANGVPVASRFTYFVDYQLQ
jgi:protein TonB